MFTYISLHFGEKKKSMLPVASQGVSFEVFLTPCKLKTTAVRGTPPVLSLGAFFPHRCNQDFFNPFSHFLGPLMLPEDRLCLVTQLHHLSETGILGPVSLPPALGLLGLWNLPLGKSSPSFPICFSWTITPSTDSCPDFDYSKTCAPREASSNVPTSE